MCITLATWHLIQKLKTNYINHPRWGALQEINPLPLLPEEWIIWNQNKSKQSKVKQNETNAPFPRQVCADLQVPCAANETVASHESGLPRLPSVVWKILSSWFPNTPLGINLYNQFPLKGLYILEIFSHLRNRKDRSENTWWWTTSLSEHRHMLSLLDNLPGYI